MISREQALLKLRSMPGTMPPGADPEPYIAALMAAQPEAPTTVTPASPAPVEAGAPISAPPPTAPSFTNQQTLAANVTQPRTVTAEDIANQARAAAEQIAKTRAAAAIDPEMEAMFARQEQGLEGQNELIDRERKRDMWSALAMAGAKMAQSTSPYFAAAMAEGLETGLMGYNKARATAAEQRARLVDKKENIVLNRFKALQEARNQAVADQAAGMSITKDQQALIRASNEELRDQAMQPMAMREAGAKAEFAEFKAKNAPKEFALESRVQEARIADLQANIAEGKARIAQGWARLNQEKATGASPERISGATASIFGELQKTARDYMELAKKAREDGRGSPDSERAAKAYEAEAKAVMSQANSLMPRGSASNPFDMSRDDPKDIPYGASMRLPDGRVGVNTRGAGAAKPATPMIDFSSLK